MLSIQISYKRRVKVSLFCCNRMQIGAVLKIRIISNKDAQRNVDSLANCMHTY